MVLGTLDKLVDGTFDSKSLGTIDEKLNGFIHYWMETRKGLKIAILIVCLLVFLTK